MKLLQYTLILVNTFTLCHAFQPIPISIYGNKNHISNQLSRQYAVPAISRNSRTTYENSNTTATLNIFKFLLVSSLFISLPCHAAIDASILLSIEDVAVYS